MVWFGMVTLLSGGARDLRRSAQTVGNVVAVFARNLLPGGKRTSIYSIQKLARAHADWYRADLVSLLDLLADGAIQPRIAAVWELRDGACCVGCGTAIPGGFDAEPGGWGARRRSVSLGF